jgi:hypothetical protein
MTLTGQRGVVIILGVVAMLTAAPALSQTITCTTAQGIRTCLGPHGYLSREWDWQGMTFGSDNQGRKWTRSRSNTLDFLTVTPPPDGR